MQARQQNKYTGIAGKYKTHIQPQTSTTNVSNLSDTPGIRHTYHGHDSCTDVAPNII